MLYLVFLFHLVKIETVSSNYSFLSQKNDYKFILFREKIFFLTIDYHDVLLG